MDATDQTAEPVRGVKRGRPRLIKAAPGVERPEGYVADGDYYRLPKDEPSASQAYAERIWVGQSPDLPVAERKARIHAALTAQGMDTNVTLPQ